MELTARLVAVAHDWDALVIVNDHPQVALDAGAHGVHLGQSDMDVCAARDLLGPDAIVGLSTHDLAQVLQSSQADYIGYGPIFATSSKVDALNPRGVRSLQEAVLATPCPVYAIGGIDASNLANVRHTKCHGWAVISDLHRHASIQEGVARLSGD